MTFLSTRTALALVVQADATTRASVSTTDDLIPHANQRVGNEVFTQANPEYTGTIHTVGDAVLGDAPSLAFDVMLRGPGGSAPPSADDYVPGRFLRACGFDEIVFAGKASAALAAGGSNSGATTTVVLDATASSTDDFYVGYPIQFAGLNGGSGHRSCSTIIAYNGTTKTATLGEKLASVPTGNFTLPPALIYRLNGSASQLHLTFDRWNDKKRYQAQNGIPTQLQMTFPTSNRGDTALPIMSCGIGGDHAATPEVDENAPSFTPAGSIPPIRNGRLALNGVNVAGASVTYDHGISVAYPPDPNQITGNASGAIVRTQRTVTLNLLEVLLSVQDRRALATAQGYVPLMLSYGTLAGRAVSFTIPQMRLSFPEIDAGGDFVTSSIAGLIDGSTGAVAIAFPYFT